MAIRVLGGQTITAAMAIASVNRAQRAVPGLIAHGRDVIVLTPDGAGYDLSARQPGVGLVVMTDRPSAVEAGAALLIGADAYLPVDLAAAATAAAVGRVMRGRLHVEPETAAALHALVTLAQGQLPHPRSADVRLALRLRARGWDWPEACASTGVSIEAVSDWLSTLVYRLRQPSSA